MPKLNVLRVSLLIVFAFVACQVESVRAQGPDSGSFWIERGDGQQPGDMSSFTTLGYTRYFSSDTTAPILANPVPWVTILQSDMFVTDNANLGGNIGLHQRFDFSGLVLGMGASYDVTQTQANNVFHQATASFDAAFNSWGIRANGYFPVATTVQAAGPADFLGQDPNQLRLEGTRVGRGVEFL